jgi:hypothetical protein
VQFTVLPVRGRPVSPLPGQAFLVRDNWDDYSFKTTSQLLCVDPGGEIREIGGVTHRRPLLTADSMGAGLLGGVDARRPADAQRDQEPVRPPAAHRTTARPSPLSLSFLLSGPGPARGCAEGVVGLPTRPVPAW